MPWRNARSQQGYALLELTLALLITGLVAAWGVQALVNRYQDAQAQAAAVWMEAVHKATLAYVQRYGAHIQHAHAASALVEHGFTDWQAPTLPELQQAGLLSTGLPSAIKLIGAARVSVWRHGDCPGDDCVVEALVHGDRPLLDPRHGSPDEAMVAQWLLAAQGRGAAVYATEPGRIRGAAYSLSSALPDGTVLPPGTVGMAVTAEHLALWSYLRVRDARNPDFQGSLTVAGDVDTGGNIALAGKLSANGDIALGGNLNSGGDIALVGDLHGAGDIALAGNLSSGGNIALAGELVIGAAHESGLACASENAVAHDISGGLLVCQSGRWRPAGKGSGGGYSFNSIHGCQTADGSPTANPVTAACSCPWYSTAMRVFDTGHRPYPEGRQQMYLCIG